MWKYQSILLQKCVILIFRCNEKGGLSHETRCIAANAAVERRSGTQAADTERCASGRQNMAAVSYNRNYLYGHCNSTAHDAMAYAYACVIKPSFFFFICSFPHACVLSALSYSQRAARSVPADWRYCQYPAPLAWIRAWQRSRCRSPAGYWPASFAG